MAYSMALSLGCALAFAAWFCALLPLLPLLLENHRQPVAGKTEDATETRAEAKAGLRECVLMFLTTGWLRVRGDEQHELVMVERERRGAENREEDEGRT